MGTFASPEILIVGSTGTIGSELVQLLSLQGIRFRALVRSLDNAKSVVSLKGAEVVVGDLNDVYSVEKSLEGIVHAFLVTNSTETAQEHQSNFVDIAKQIGLLHVVKLSQFAAAIDSPVRFLRYHAAIEEKIKNAGINYTFLKPNLFMQGFLGFRDQISTQGKFFASIGEAAVSVIDARDIAAVAAKVVTNNNHFGKTYPLTGPKSLSHRQMASIFTLQLQYPVSFINVMPGEMRKAILNAGFPPWQAEGLIEDYKHYKKGEAGEVTSVVEDITGIAPRDFGTFVQDYRHLFLKQS